MKLRPFRYSNAIEGLRSLAAAGWPVWGNLACVLAGLMSVGLGLWWRQQAMTVDAPSVNSRAAALPRIADDAAPTTSAWMTAPQFESYVDDLSTLLKTLKDSGLTPGNIEYEGESGAPLPVTLRFVTLHLVEDYPRFKQFVALLLKRLSHASLQEVQFERKDTGSAKSQITVRLAFVYRLQPDSAGATSP